MAYKPPSSMIMTSLIAGATGSALTMLFMSKKEKSMSISEQAEQLKERISEELEGKKHIASEKLEKADEAMSSMLKR